ncbi:MAG: Mini-ribonuclease 3 [Ruminococcaceae bacterium]|nr:Mini-ribonuclease 3 [Oscillospiraceae bacterium]
MFDFTPDMSVSQFSSLQLAYIGDAVYELYIRTMISKDKNIPVNKLHREATTYVKAKAQSDIIRKIEPYLTEQELSVYKRGRNAKANTAAKNADIVDYRHATGFEALIGYIYLKKDFERLDEILKLSFRMHNES